MILKANGILFDVEIDYYQADPSVGYMEPSVVLTNIIYDGIEVGEIIDPALVAKLESLALKEILNPEID